MADDDLQKKRKSRNFALGAVLIGLAVLFYAITIARMG
ncbi:hypothetical protein DFR51_0109 [Sphingosinicella microcystinivorans]|uniref:Protoheme IX farnesyltransferase n=1 Tax=Sphingosinicella microcystinivorans TaxID=335406 RepID=A0ABX9SZS6_SPHMI|nr:hypothetical protein DFR51_0109 [Sphingosinicella microcystinivorans]